MANNLSPIPLSNYFELNTEGRTHGHSLKLNIAASLKSVATFFLKRLLIDRICWTKRLYQ